MHAIGAVGRSLVFSTPNTHIAGETSRRRGWLRPQRVLKALQPPGIWLRRLLLEEAGDRGLDLRFLGRNQLDRHRYTRIRDLQAVHPYEGSGRPRLLSPLRVMSIVGAVKQNPA